MEGRESKWDNILGPITPNRSSCLILLVVLRIPVVWFVYVSLDSILIWKTPICLLVAFTRIEPNSYSATDDETFCARNFSGARLSSFLNKGLFSTLSPQSAGVFSKNGTWIGEIQGKGGKRRSLLLKGALILPGTRKDLRTLHPTGKLWKP